MLSFSVSQALLNTSGCHCRNRLRRFVGIAQASIRSRLDGLLAVSDAVQFDEIGAANPAYGLSGHEHDVVARFQTAGGNQNLFHLE